MTMNTDVIVIGAGLTGLTTAYLLARENEIKCVRMVLTGKLNGMPEGTIRERLREMYV